MEFLAGVVFAAFVATLTVGVVVWFFVNDRRERHEVAAWQAYARRAGLRLARARPGGALVRLEGRYDGMPFSVEVCKVEGGARTVTRASARAIDPTAVRVVAGSGSLRLRAARPEGVPFRSGDAAFDAAFDVRVDDTRAAEDRVTAALRRALQRFPTTLVGGGVAFAYDHGAAVVEWPGGDVDTAQLRAALDVLVAACPVTRRAMRQMN